MIYKKKKKLFVKKMNKPNRFNKLRKNPFLKKVYTKKKNSK